MKKMKVYSNDEAIEFVSTALWAMDYPSDLTVTTTITEDDQIVFQASYEAMYHGEQIKCIMPISSNNFSELMTIGMSLKGYTTEYINFLVRNKKVQYEAMTEVVSLDTLARKRRKG